MANQSNEHGVGLRAEIEQSLNRWSAEGRSNTPDFILAKFLIGCLNAFDVAVNSREEWYGRNPIPGQLRTGESLSALKEVSDGPR
jgi:hypothetical protein